MVLQTIGLGVFFFLVFLFFLKIIINLAEPFVALREAIRSKDGRSEPRPILCFIVFDFGLLFLCLGAYAVTDHAEFLSTWTVAQIGGGLIILSYLVMVAIGFIGGLILSFIRWQKP